MRLLIFSDIHGDLAALGRLVSIPADYYFAAGDLTSWGRELDRCGKVLEPVAEKLYVLPGNHESARRIGAFCAKFGFHAFHEETLTIGRYYVAGFGYSNPTPFNTPGEYSEAEIATRLEKFSRLKPLVLICHCPPFRTPLDRIREGVYGGSHAIGEFIAQQQPEYFFCGHIHEAEGASVSLGETRGVNVGKRGHLLEVTTQVARSQKSEVRSQNEDASGG